MIRVPVRKPELSDQPDTILTSLKRITQNGKVSNHELPSMFEKLLAEYLGSVFCVAMDSLSEGLHVTLQSLGIGEGDNVITSSFIPHSLISTIFTSGAHVTFADIRQGSFSLQAEDIERKINPRTRAVIVTHPFGLPADIVEISTICRNYDLTLIEVVENGLGSRIDRHHIGSFGYAGIFHFHPRKSLIGGDGCVVATDHVSLATACKNFHGKNASLSPFHAALGIKHLEKIEPHCLEREELASYYDVHLGGLKGLRLVLPHTYARWNHQYYPIRLAEIEKKRLADKLLRQGIATSFGPKPAHLHPYIETLLRPSRLTYTEEAYQETFLLPIFSGLTRIEQDEIIQCAREALA